MKTLAVNKRASFDYEILESYDAGIELTGHETKSAKMGRANLKNAYGLIQSGEVFVLGFSISSFQQNNTPEGYDPERKKKLLLTKKEIKYLVGKTKTGLTIVPLKIYNNKRGFLKVQIGLGKGKKKYDKRESIKKREVEREIRRVKK